MSSYNVVTSSQSHTVQLGTQSNYNTTLQGTVTPRKFIQLIDVNMVDVQNGDLVAYDAASQTFIPTAGNVAFAITATNVIGGIASVTSLQVSGDALFDNNIYVSGIITSSYFIGDLIGIASTSIDVIGGIGSITQLTVSGDTSLTNLYSNNIYSVGIITATQFVGNFIGTATNSNYAQVAGISTLSEGLTGTPNIDVANINSSGISTLGTIQISSGIISSTTGIVTYYGDGSNLTGTYVSITTSTVDENQYLTYVVGVGNTRSFFVNTSELVFNPAKGFLGIGVTNPTTNLDVFGDANISGVVTATNFIGDLSGTADYAISAGVASVGGIGIGTTTSSLSGVGITTLIFPQSEIFINNQVAIIDSYKQAFPIGDYGEVIQLIDAFGISTSSSYYQFDCLIEPIKDLDKIDLGIL